ncbi:MAG: hypothetical protein CM15mP68_3650 [Pseudomonadota bacterium]|nr:MAG: hypothetical protein CM15mP68_3650 [Pseudomonadota bacterium]
MDFTGALNFLVKKAIPKWECQPHSDARPFFGKVHPPENAQRNPVVAASFCLIRPHQFWIGLMLVKFEHTTKEARRLVEKLLPDLKFGQSAAIRQR